jgi:hypothetical protein
LRKTGELQASKAAESRLHANVAPPSGEENVIDALEVSIVAGTGEIAVFGGVVSTVNACVAATLVFPRVSAAVT